MGCRGAGAGASAELGRWGRASPASCIPVSLLPASFPLANSKPRVFLAGGSGMLQGPGLSSDAVHGVLWRGELAVTV